ncbi:MAG: nucleotide exchange factor GrpE [Alphaproteobacteria bacterium]|nr:nucleotide exchange factor GrpE [Alphaproteobacteria bacterium]
MTQENDTTRNTPPQDQPASMQADAAGTAPASDQSPEALMAEAAARIAALEAEAAGFKDKWLRAEAEMQNLRNRTKREVEEARAYAATKFARDVAELAENLARAMAAMPAAAADEPESLGKIRDGISSIERAFLAALERNGVARVEAAGQPFNPDLHQAMMEQESAAAAPGTVLAAWSPAWTLNGRLLKPAMVVVAKAPPGGASAAAPASADPGSAATPGGKLDTTA